MDSRVSAHSQLFQRVGAHLLEVLALSGEARRSAEQLLLLNLVRQLDIRQDEDKLFESESGQLQVLHGRVVEVTAEFLLSEALVE